jgi:hypothetical protein
MVDMNQALFLSELRKIALVVIAYCLGKGWLSAADSSLIGGLLPGVGLLAGPWLWGLYTMLDKKLVPQDSIAVQPLIPGHVLATGDHVVIQDAKFPDAGTSQAVAKVVGALLFSVMLPFLIDPAHAQFPKPKPLNEIFAPAPKTTATTFDSALKEFGDGVQKIEKPLVDKGIADLQAAIKDATSHNDNISLPCWNANLDLLQSLPSQWPEPPTLPMGLALSIQIQRDLLNSITGSDAKSLKVACAALWGDQLKIVVNLGALIGIRIASGGLF